MWHDYLHNNIFIKMLYKNVPNLENIDIHEIIISHNGPLIKISFDLPRFADFAPKKWALTCNTVRMTLEFGGSEDLYWEGWSEHNVGTISIKEERFRRYFVMVKTDQMRMSFFSHSCFTQDIRGVFRSDRQNKN